MKQEFSLMPNPLTIEVPASLTAALTKSKDEATLPRWALEALVVEAVREHVISRGFGGELLGMDFGQREEFYAQHGVTYDLTNEELDEDEQGRDRMFGRQ
jgi:hypothetical protein